MKPEMRDQFRKEFELITPNMAPSPLDADYASVGSKTAEVTHRSGGGAHSRVPFDIDMSHCDWRAR